MPSIQMTRRILEFIKRYLIANGEAPTIKEIASNFDMTSSGSVHAHLRKMEQHGWIKRSRRWRGIQIVEQEQKNAA